MGSQGELDGNNKNQRARHNVVFHFLMSDVQNLSCGGIVARDEKRIFYDDPKREKSRIKSISVGYKTQSVRTKKVLHRVFFFIGISKGRTLLRVDGTGRNSYRGYPAATNVG